ncbi:MAG: Fic family protein [Nanoarchaeota archaeon]|nr:Fic family protein [Nanoarchaeota archaeon]
MVTKYDVFVELYKSGNPKGTIDIVKIFRQKKTEYQRIRKILDTLVGLKLIEKNKYGYQAAMNAKHQHLFDMLKFCMKNGVNYNELFDESVAKYLSKAFLKKSFGMKDIDMNAKTVSKVSNILEKNGFILVLSRKPFKAVVPYNSFLGDLAAYYGHHPLVTRKRDDEYFDEIQNELSKFKKLRVANVRKYQELTETYKIQFIHHSLSIEGNPITLAQMFKLLRDKVVPGELSMESIHEVENYQKAFLRMMQNVQDDPVITKENILNYHFIAMQHKKKIAGRFRDDQVWIKGNVDYKVSHYSEIEKGAAALLKKYNAFNEKKKHSLREIFGFAAYLHNEFQHIHPFFDGNSRTTRLITFHFLLMNDIPILDIPLGLLEEYVFSTKGAKKRNDKRLGQVLQQIILFNLKAINEKLS